MTGRSLTSTQLSHLQSLADAGNIVQYYTDLNTYGETYGSLALDVAQGTGLSGQVARAFAAAMAHEHGVVLDPADWPQISLALMKADATARAAAQDVGDPSLDLPVSYIRSYHVSVFALHDLPPDAWTAYVPLALADSAGEDALWEQLKQPDMLSQFLNGDATILNVLFANAVDHDLEYVSALMGGGVGALIASSMIDIAVGSSPAEVWLRAMFIDGAAFAAFAGTTTAAASVAIPGGTGEVLIGNGAAIGSGISALFETILLRADVNDTLSGGSGGDQIFGFSGADSLSGGGGDDGIAGGAGADTMSGGAGNDVIVGGDQGLLELFGSGKDLVTYATSPGEVTVVLAAGAPGVSVANDGFGGQDLLIGVEGIQLSSHNDTVVLTGDALLGSTLQGLQRIDGGVQEVGGADFLDLSGVDFGVVFARGGVRAANAKDFGSITNPTDLATLVTGAPQLTYQNFEQFAGTDHVDVLDDQQTRGEYFLGDGGDIFKSAGAGTLVHLGVGGGRDDVWWNPAVGVADFEADDRLTFAGVIPLFGGTRNAYNDSPWAWSWGGLVQWALNEEGDLVVKVANITAPGVAGEEAGEMFIQGWAATQAPGPGGVPVGAGNIIVVEHKTEAVRLFDPRHTAETFWASWKYFGVLVHTMIGTDVWSDPLVFDLDGDGLELTAVSSTSPKFDVDADLYSERVGWVARDDGMLARDIDGDGKIGDSRELFGGRNAGFEVLATLDGNHDGVVNASDNGLADFNADGVINSSDLFSGLKIWRDLNQNGTTESGELQSLSTYNIVGVNVAATPSTSVINGNPVAATGTFVRGDATTGTVGEALLATNQRDSTYLGAPITISTAAAAEPDLKGFGTLVSLRQALSVEAGGLTAVNAALATLDPETGHDLASLRTAIRPILQAWAEGSPLRIADGSIVSGPEGVSAYADIPIIRGSGLINDYSWKFEDDVVTLGGQDHNVGVWTFVSGLTITFTAAAGEPLPDLSKLAATFGEAPSGTSVSVLIDGHTKTQTTYTYADGSTLVGLSDTSAPTTLRALVAGDGPIDGVPFTIDTVLGSDLAFFERYLGDQLPFHTMPVNATAAMTAMEALIANMNEGLDLIAARIAVQSDAFASVFEGLTYSAVDNSFHATTGRLLAPTFENLLQLADAETDPTAYLLTWKPLLDAVIGDYNRGSGLLNTTGFVAANIVAAFEAVSPGFSFTDAVEGLGLDPDQFILGAGSLAGTTDHDIFYLDGSDQTAAGGAGLDNYIVGDHLGHDVINDEEDPLTNFGEDVVRFTTLDPGDVRVDRDGIDLVITVIATNETLRIAGQFYGELAGPFGDRLWPDKGVVQIVFADGTVWDQNDMARAASHVDAGATTILGTNDNDYLDGGAGDDRLEGGNDGDVYVFGSGYGHDMIKDFEDNAYRQSFDILNFKDLDLDDLTFSRAADSDDLLITVTGTSDSLMIEGQFTTIYTGIFDTWWTGRIEIFAFADGSLLSYDQVMTKVIDDGKTAGADSIYGYDREDVLDGGAGDDFLSGGNENDTYIFGRGYGHDVFADEETNILGGEMDALVFGAGIDVEDIVFTHEGNDLIVSIVGTDDSVRLRNHFQITETGVFGPRGFNQFERFVWADGTVWNSLQVAEHMIESAQTAGDDTIVGTHFADEFEGGPGNDRFIGDSGKDTYRYGVGDGNDVILDDAGSPFAEDGDTLEFEGALTPADIRLERYGPDLENIRLVIIATGESISIEKQFHHDISPGLMIVEEIKFSNGVTWSQQDLSQAYIAQHQTSGADLIDGNYLDNTIAGGAGDDTLRGQEGDDRYVFQTGFGNDVIEEVHSDGALWADDDTVAFGTGIARADLQLARNGGDLVITFSGMTDKLTVHGQFEHTLNAPSFSDIERLVFSDGTIVTEQDIRLALLAQQVSTGADTVVGFYTNDTIDGGAGNDLLDGRGGSDTYLFGTGSGQDRISETLVTAFEDTPDTVAFGAGLTASDLTFQVVGDNLVISILGGSDSLTIESQYASSGYTAVEQFSFAGGTVLTAAEVKALAIAGSGTAGADTISGTPGADTLDGKAGDDRLEGGGGNDVYVFQLGSGHDKIHDVGTGTPADEVRFGSGILPADIVGERVGNDLILRITGHTDTLTIEGHFGAVFVASPIETFVFANGTSWGEPEILNLLYGSSTAIVGSQFGDSLAGTSGADVLVGLEGSDTLSGGAGSDTYFAGQGSALIIENGADSGTDLVKLTQFTTSAIAVSRSGDDAVLTYSGGAVRLQGQFNAGGVEQIALAGGVTWAADDLRAAYLTAAGTSGADDIVGFNGRSDTLSGAGGNDTLSGRTGSDTYTFALGTGEDLIIDSGDAAATDRLVFASGIAPTDLVLVADSPATGDLTITFGNGAGKVVLRGELTADGSGVEEIAFSDGTVWNYATILDKADDAAPVGDQTLTGDAGANTLSGGGGSDMLTGGAGADLYQMNVMGGVDRIVETYDAGVTDRLVFGSGLLASNLIVTRSTSDLNDISLSFAGHGGTVKLEDEFYPSSGDYGVEQIQLGDGTVWTKADLKTAYLTQAQTSGNDTVYGFDGATTFNIGALAGTDRIVEGYDYGVTDRLVLGAGLTAANALITRSASDLTTVTLSFTGVSGSLILDKEFYPSSGAYGVEEIQFDGGVTWSRSDIANAYLTQAQTSGNDTVYGFDGATTFTFNSLAGADRIVEGYDYGVTDRLVLGTGLNHSNVLVTRSASDLSTVTLSFTGFSGSITLDKEFYPSSGAYGVEEVQFGNGTVWGRNDIRDAYLTQAQTAGNDSIYGFDGATTFTFNGLSGADVIVEGYDYGVTDRLVFGSGLNAGGVSLTRSLTDLDDITVTFSGQSGSILLDEQLYPSSGAYGIEELQFGDSTVWNRSQILSNAWFRGGAGADTITATTDNDNLDGAGGADVLNGGAGSDVLVGGSGDDQLTGGGGADTFSFKPGFGIDVINDFSHSESDIIEVDHTIFANFADVQSHAVQDGLDVVIAYDSLNSIKLRNTNLSALQATDFHFT